MTKAPSGRSWWRRFRLDVHQHESGMWRVSGNNAHMTTSRTNLPWLDKLYDLVVAHPAGGASFCCLQQRPQYQSYAVRCISRTDMAVAGIADAVQLPTRHLRTCSQNFHLISYCWSTPNIVHRINSYRLKQPLVYMRQVPYMTRSTNNLYAMKQVFNHRNV
jgi:hypothetical protein